MNWVLLQNSLLVAGATALAATALGFAAALWLNTLKGRWRRLLLGCSILELALPDTWI